MTDIANQPRGIVRRITLIVEGFHDASTIDAIFEAADLAGIEVRIDRLRGMPRPQNRDSRLNTFLNTRLNESGVDAVGLVVDADDDSSRVRRRLQRLNVLKNALMEDNLDSKPEDGCVADYHVGTYRKKFGFWIMPDNRRPGQLEDFVLRMIPDADPVEQPAREFIGNLPKDVVDNAGHKATKHIAHAWLSAYYPGWSFDDALRNGQLVFFAEDPVLGAFKRWLERLAG